MKLCEVMRENGSKALKHVLYNKRKHFDNKELDEALYCAIEEGHEDCVRLLLQSGANVETTNVNGESPLILASRKGLQNCVLILVQCEAHLEATDRLGETCLIKAVQNGYADIVQFLLEQSADTKATDIFGKTCLMVAAQLGLDDVVSLLIEHGCCINACSDRYQTALLIAVEGYFYQFYPSRQIPFSNREGRYLEVISLLLDNGADNSSLSSDWTTLNICLRAACFDVSENKDHNRTELINKIVMILISNYSGDLNRCDEHEGFTLLMHASVAGFTKCVQLLLDKGCSVNYESKYKQTALYLAINWNHLATAEVLLHHGADPNVIFNGIPELMNQLIKCDLEMIKLLIRYGYKSDFTNREYRGICYSCMLHLNLPSSTTDYNTIEQLIKIMYECGFCNNEQILSIMKDPSTVNIWIGHPERKVRLIKTCSNPLTLVSLSRIAISRSLLLKPNRLTNIDKLYIPLTAKDFLKYNDL